MSVLSSANLLDAWELGLGGTWPGRAIAILQAAFPEVPRGELASLSIGHRDWLLLALRRRLFGSRILAYALCPACGDQLELSADTQAMLDVPVPGPTDRTCSAAGVTIRFRLPNTLDLEACLTEQDAASARQRLIQRCVLSLMCEGQAPSEAELGPETLAAVEGEIRKTDSLAEIHLEATCPSCGHSWRELFDVVSFFWREIDVWARRLLGEVHLLASRYGWSEGEILAMGPARREFYLQAT